MHLILTSFKNKCAYTHLFFPQCLKYKTEEHKSLYETEQLVQSAMAQMCNLSMEDLARQRGT